MELNVKLTHNGIQLSIGDSISELKPSDDADQHHPRGHYVYAHQDEHGNIFYIGKGFARRAWSDDRHVLWTRYVDKHLNGKYTIVILRDNLSSDAAEHLESSWIGEFGESLVNWINFGRKTDFDALDRFHKLRNANRALIAQGKIVEKLDCNRAVEIYIRAIASISAYSSIRYEGGLVGQLLDEDISEHGSTGEIEALDRLTLCLVKLGLGQEARNHSESYFQMYRRDSGSATAERIRKRVEKACSQRR